LNRSGQEDGQDEGELPIAAQREICPPSPGQPSTFIAHFRDASGVKDSSRGLREV